MVETARKLSGRRYSKRAERTVETIEEAVAEWTKVKPFPTQVAEAVARARNFLQARGLPTDRIVKSDSGVHQLDLYILRVCGLARDSFEHLAARVIVAASDMENSERDRALEGAFRLGELNVLTKVYAAETQARRRIGSKPKRRVWADLAAEQVSSWDDLPDSLCPMEIETDAADYTIYRDGETLCCQVTGEKKVRKLERSSFEKRYLTKAGQKQR